MSRTTLIVAAYLALLGAAVPWYWAADERMVVLGFPVWVVVAIGVSLLTSLLTAVILMRPWPHESTAGHDDSDE